MLTSIHNNKLSFTALALLMFSAATRAFVSRSVVSRSTTITTTTRVIGTFSNPFLAAAATPPPPLQRRAFHMSALSNNERKAGVAAPEELRAFVAKAGDRLLVVDVRNPDAAVEPGDPKSLAVAAVPSGKTRPQGVHLIYDRTTQSMPLPDVAQDTPMITHCGGGGRGQKAKEFLEQHGFTNILNGGGPKETECWAEFGSK